MNEALRRRLVKGIGAQSFAKLAQIFIQLITVPILISMWGVDLYGEWLIVSAVATYLTLSDVGIGTAGANELIMQAGRNDRNEAQKVFQSMTLASGAVSLGIVTICATLLATLPAREWLHVTILTPQSFLSIFCLMGVGIVLGSQKALIYGGFGAVGEYGLGIFLISVSTLLDVAGSLVAVFLHQGPSGAAVGSVVGGTMGFTLMLFVFKRKCPWLHYGYRQANWATIRRLWRHALAFLAFPIGNALNLQGIVIVIGATTGPGGVAIFSTLRTLTRIVTSFAVAIGSSTSAEISRAYGSGDIQLVRKLHDKTCQVSLWVAAAAVISLVVLGPWFIPVWTHGKIAISWPVFMMLLAAATTGALWNTSQFTQYSTNNHKNLSIVYVSSNMFCIFQAYILLKFTGVFGASLSILTCDLIILIFVLRYSLALLDEKLGEFFSFIVRPPIFRISF